eukprot:TRINITY_DN2858_c0_g2_i1.p1 TRINITY_DN2858_c0_g2~~TRINITY_DN2858_c0_g2_i1.p1  ORF type:complete len:388 (-),score=54.32 TRINITY_DN2858_c0_g2_i1:759-1922(-)
MTKTKRTYYEAVVQKFLPKSLQSREFIPTSNVRNEAMFKEAMEFAKWLKIIDKNLHALESGIDRFMNDNEAFMQSSLPRIYEETTLGLVNPLDPEAKQVGEGVNLDQLLVAPQELKSKLNSDVIQPLRNWLLGFEDIKQRMQEVESLRLEVDSRRRTAFNMKASLSRARTHTYEKGEPDQTKVLQLEKQDARVKHKTSKADSTLAQYKELEQDTFHQLSDLVKDTVYLKQYMAEAMLIVADCFGMAYQAYGGRFPLAENRSNLQIPSQVTEEESEQQQPSYSEPVSQEDSYNAPKPTLFKASVSNPFGRPDPYAVGESYEVIEANEASGATLFRPSVSNPFGRANSKEISRGQSSVRYSFEINQSSKRSNTNPFGRADSGEVRQAMA